MLVALFYSSLDSSLHQHCHRLVVLSTSSINEVDCQPMIRHLLQVHADQLRSISFSMWKAEIIKQNRRVSGHQQQIVLSVHSAIAKALAHVIYTFVKVSDICSKLNCPSNCWSISVSLAVLRSPCSSFLEC